MRELGTRVNSMIPMHEHGDSFTGQTLHKASSERLHLSIGYLAKKLSRSVVLPIFAFGDCLKIQLKPRIIRFPDGRRILRSTKQQDRQSALAVAMEFERASKLARRGELVEVQAREVLRDIMKRADIGETIQRVSIKSHFDDWLASKKVRDTQKLRCSQLIFNPKMRIGRWINFIQFTRNPIA